MWAVAQLASQMGHWAAVSAIMKTQAADGIPRKTFCVSLENLLLEKQGSFSVQLCLQGTDLVWILGAEGVLCHCFSITAANTTKRYKK